MKEKFWGYIPYDDDTFKKLWEDSTIVVDANILLNLYRYTKETQQQVIKCLEKLSSRLWIPYNTMQEYFNNRIQVICSQQKLYQEIKDEVNLKKVKEKISGIRHLTLSNKKDSILKILDKCEEEINNIIDKDKENENNYIRNDLVLSRLEELFDGKVGDEISDQLELEKLRKEIDIRYEKKIPPGFEDAKKNKDGRKYGDCINWFQIMEYSKKNKKNKKNIIYISDDQKDDWIKEVNGEKIGPRPELLNEFYKKTNGKIIYIYSTIGFLNSFNKYISRDLTVSENTINEINELETIRDIDYITDEELSNTNYAHKLLNRIIQQPKSKYIVSENGMEIKKFIEKNDDKELSLIKFEEAVSEFINDYIEYDEYHGININANKSKLYILSGLMEQFYGIASVYEKIKDTFNDKYSYVVENIFNKAIVIKTKVENEIKYLQSKS